MHKPRILVSLVAIVLETKGLILKKYLCFMMKLFGMASGAQTISSEYVPIVYRDSVVVGFNPLIWDPNFAQVTCDPQDALSGLSVGANSRDHVGHAALCTTIRNSNFLGRTLTKPLLFSDGDNRRYERRLNGNLDWDYNYYKLECDRDEYVVGVSQGMLSIDKGFHGLQCAKGIFFDDTAVISKRVFSGSDDRGSQKGGEWDDHYFKGQCRDDEYVVGVSFSQGGRNKAPHAILCSTAGASQGRLNIVYKSNNDLFGTATLDGEKLQDRKITPNIKLEKTPALASFNGKMYIAYKSVAVGGRSALCFSYSEDRGANYATPLCDSSSVSIEDSPAVAVFNGKLYFAFRASNTNKLCVTSISPDSTSIPPPICTPHGMANSPAMTAFNGNLYIAFKGEMDDYLYVSHAAEGGHFVKADQKSNNKILHSPTIAAFNGKLYIGYKTRNADGSLTLTSSSDGESFSNPTGFGNIRLDYSPAMAIFGGELYVAYKSKTAQNLLCLSKASGDGARFSEPKCSDANPLEGTGTPSVATQSFADTLKNVRFAVYGDMPYGAPVYLPYVEPAANRDDGELLSKTILPRLAEATSIPFIMHVGDIGRPGGIARGAQNVYDSCTEEFRTITIGSWTKLNKPLFYTPGDNDWTDCNKERLKASSYNPLLELRKVRSKFFSASRNASQASLNEFETQPDYEENQIWRVGDILYVTIHVVGSENGLVTSDKDDAPQRVLEANARATAAIRWLDKAKHRVGEDQSFSALVVVFHVDSFGNDWTCWNRYNDPYGGICQTLTTAAREIDRPLLVVHGDTNAHCLRKVDPKNNKFWILNAPGDFKSLDADIVSFHGRDSAMPFTAVGLLTGRAPLEICDYSQ